MATFDATPGVPSLVEPDDQDRAGAYASLNQLAQYFAPLQQPPPTYVDFFTQLAATGVPPIGYQQSKANALNYAGVPVTGPTTALSNQLLLVDASAASVPITLLANPTVNDLVAVVVSALTAPNVVTVSANGNAFNIAGGPQTLTLPLLGEIAQFQYVGAGIWVAAVMANPGAVDPAGAAQAAADAVRKDLSAQIAALSQRPQSQLRTFQTRIPGSLSLGVALGGTNVEAQAIIPLVRARLTIAATGSGVTVQIFDQDTAAVYYTLNVPAGVKSYSDTAAYFTVPDSTFLGYNITGIGSGCPGVGLVIEMAEGTGSVTTDPGTVLNLQAGTVTAAGATLTWDYTTNGVQADHFATRYTTGATAPASLTDGIPGPDVNGTTQTLTLTGLPSGTAYKASVFPVGADGTVGAYASVAFTTAATRPTSYNGTVTGVRTTTISSSVIGFTWTPPNDGVFAGVEIRRKNNSSTTSWSGRTDGRPAGGGINATGAGLDYAAAQGNTFADTGLNPSVPYAYALWAYDVYGNYSPTYVTLTASTVAASTSGQGLYGLVPSTSAGFSLDYTTNFAAPYVAGTPMLGFSDDTVKPEWIKIKDGYKQQTQGANAAANVDIVTDPDNPTGSNKVLRLRQRIITNGPFSPTGNASWAYNQHPTWSGSAGTSGTGWYGGRFQLYGDSHQFAYGALEFTCRIGDSTGKTPGSTGSDLSTLANNIKGGNMMWYPATGWPRQELDLWEIFNAGNGGINNHYYDPAKGSTASTQLSNAFALDITKWTTVTCVYEKAPAGAAGNGRIRVWYTQVGVNLGAGTGAPKLKFDTDPPYSDSGYNGQWNATNVGYLLSQIESKFVGGSLEYTGYWQDTKRTIPGAQFDAGTGTTATTRQAGSYLVDYVSLWQQP